MEHNFIFYRVAHVFVNSKFEIAKIFLKNFLIEAPPKRCLTYTPFKRK